MKKILMIIFIFFTNALVANINFTNEEKEYIQNKKEITVTNELEYEPFDFYKDGKASGYSIELLELALKDTGLKIKYVTKSWNELVKDFENKKIDLVHTIFKTQPRLEKYYFSNPYLFTSNSLVFNKEDSFKSYEDLFGKKVAVAKGWAQDQMLEQYPKIQRVYFENIKEILDAVYTKKVDATILGSHAAIYNINKLGYVFLKVSTLPNMDKSKANHFATLNDEKILINIINKAIDNIDVYSRQQLSQKWFGDIEAQNEEKVNLSQDDLDYLANTTFNLHINEWAPFRIYNKETKEYTGMALDYFKIIVEKLNLKYNIIHYDNFFQRFSKQKNDPNAISIFTPQVDYRQDYETSSLPFDFYPIALVTTLDKSFIYDFKILNGKKIAVTNNGTAHRFLKLNYPEINFVLTDNTQKALEKVLSGEVYGAVDLFPVLYYDLNIYLHKNLKISGLSEKKLPVNISVNNENKRLIPILNKVISTLPANLKNSIENKWLKDTKEITNYKWLWYVIGVFVLLIIALQYRYTLTLKRKQEEETRLLQDLLNTQKLAKLGNWKNNLVTNEVYWDKVIYEMFKISPNTVLTTEMLKKYVYPEDLEKLYKIINSLSVESPEVTTTIRFIRSSGEIGYAYDRIIGKFDDNNKLIEISGFVQDITEKFLLEEEDKKKAQQLQEQLNSNKIITEELNIYKSSLETKVKEQTNEILKQNRKLKLSTELLQNIIDVAPIRIFWKDVNGVYLGANKLFLQDAKLESQDQIIGKNDFDMVWKSVANLYVNDDNRVMQTKKPKLQYEEPQTDKDGNTIYLLTSKIPLIDENGQVYGILGVYDDITQKKKKDVLFIEQSKMAALGEMIGNIAHQWRQPLSVISSTATGLQLQSELGELNSEELDQMCTAINDNVQYLSQTIDTFRNFIKGSSEKYDVDINRAIGEGIALIKDSIKNNFIELIDNTSNENAVILKQFPKHEFAQVIINVINNAKDIIKERKIENGWIKIDNISNKNKVIITIEDNGGGIPESVLPKIFEPYFTTKHKYNGTGLGLYMSYKIVTESLGGKIYAKNTENGAKFFIEFNQNLRNVKL